MMAQLPLNADKIFVDWATDEGGICVSAFTDDKGIPFIGIHPLNRMGKPNGLPCWFRRKHLMTDFVVGFRGWAPIVIYMDIEVSEHGISLILSSPFDAPHRYQCHLSAPWGSEPPCYGFTTVPSNSNWPILSFPYGVSE